MKDLKIIAEIGSNWNGRKIIAKKMIKGAKLAGADYVKFQMWKADELFSKSDKHWNIIKKSEFTPSIAKEFKKYADTLKIGCFWSVFYPDAVDCLEELNVKLYKIASWTAALKHPSALETMKKIAQTKKPVIISMGYGGDANKIKKIFRHNKKYFLYCVSKYPAKLNNLDFNKMKKFDGFSDHTEGYLAPILYYLNTKNSKKLKFLEKHVSIKNSKGPDKPFSMDMVDFEKLIAELRKIPLIK